MITVTQEAPKRFVPIVIKITDPETVVALRFITNAVQNDPSILNDRFDRAVEVSRQNDASKKALLDALIEFGRMIQPPHVRLEASWLDKYQ